MLLRSIETWYTRDAYILKELILRFQKLQVNTKSGANSPGVGIGRQDFSGDITKICWSRNKIFLHCVRTQNVQQLYHGMKVLNQ